MGSLDSALTKKALAQNTCIRKADDKSVALRIRQVGGAAVTSVTVTISTGIVLIDGDGTTTIVFATSTTLGAVADAINASTNWECKILDGLRADASDDTLLDGAISASSTSGISYYDAFADTDGVDYATLRCTVDRSVGEDRPKGSHRVRLIEGKYNQNVSAAEAGAVRVYEWDASSKSETLIYAITSVDITDTTVSFASGLATIDGGYGNDLIFRVVDGTSITDDAANFIQAIYTIE